jgi:hypothetical protein
MSPRHAGRSLPAPGRPGGPPTNAPGRSKRSASARSAGGGAGSATRCDGVGGLAAHAGGRCRDQPVKRGAAGTGAARNRSRGRGASARRGARSRSLGGGPGAAVVGTASWMVVGDGASVEVVAWATATPVPVARTTTVATAANTGARPRLVLVLIGIALHSLGTGTSHQRPRRPRAGSKAALETPEARHAGPPTVASVGAQRVRWVRWVKLRNPNPTRRIHGSASLHVHSPTPSGTSVARGVCPGPKDRWARRAVPSFGR